MSHSTAGRGERLRSLLRQPWLWAVALTLLLGNWLISSHVDGGPDPARIPYTVLRTEAEHGNVAEVTSQRDEIRGRFRAAVRTPGREPVLHFETVRPAFAEDDRLLELLIDNGVSVNARPLVTARPLWQSLLVGFGPALLLVGVLIWIMGRSRPGGMSGLGRSRAKRYDASDQRTTFADVAGIEDAEAELVEVVDFLRDPQRFRALGARIPRGVLLSGPPGTGKTLLARAVAGEADVPFFIVSASEFVEMVVGVGASRVRDLFAQANKAGQAIIFIDELDAIGRARTGGGAVQHNDEREQALNQILTEMDGFTPGQGVIVIAATNRPELLDKALLRPGRFDRHVTVNPPDQAGRRHILEVHTRDVPLARGVDLGDIAAATPGMAGAALKNLVNEAAILAARRNRERVTREDFGDAMEKILLGAERNITVSTVERERTAYHEAGHALLGMIEPGADPVRKVSIVPRGMSLGVTFQSASEDRYGYDEDYLRGRIAGALGGRAAEQIIYGRATTGAEGDLEQVSKLARMMVGRWGMSEAIGPMSVLPPDGDVPLAHGAVAESTRQLVDTEARRIVEECYEHALRRLNEHREQLESLARALLERETLDEIDAYAAAGFQPPEPSSNGASAIASAFRRIAFGHDGG
jgi:cell division protease FtsH